MVVPLRMAANTILSAVIIARSQALAILTASAVRVPPSITARTTTLVVISARPPVPAIPSVALHASLPTAAVTTSAATNATLLPVTSIS